MYIEWYTSVEMSTRYLSIRELRPKLPGVVRDAAGTYSRYVVTRRGKPEAVLMGIDDYERLMETLEIEKDPILLRRLQQAESDRKRGKKGRSLQAIHKELGV